MKNCPWFSLRSNSIELRFRSVRWGNFLVNTIQNLIKSKNNSEFASLIELFYSLRSIQTQISVSDLRLFRLHSLKSCFSRSLSANFDSSLVDTRSVILGKVNEVHVMWFYLTLICITFNFSSKYMESHSFSLDQALSALYRVYESIFLYKDVYLFGSRIQPQSWENQDCSTSRIQWVFFTSNKGLNVVLVLLPVVTI